MNLSNLVSASGVGLIALLIATSALQAGADIAPAPLAGAGLLYFAVSASAAGAWIAAKVIGNRIRRRRDKQD